MRERQKRFLDLFYQLFVDAVAAGVERPRVSTHAALLAGYGGESWCAVRARQAAYNAAARLLGQPDSRAYLEGRGLAYGWNGWRLRAAQVASEQGETEGQAD